MKINRMTSLLFLLVCLVLSMWIPQSYAANYFDGKTITIYVGGSPGGGMDLGARAIAPYLANHLPGNPNIVINNMGGAGGNQARNYVYEKAKRDGTGLFWSDWAPISQAIKEVGLRADFTKMSLIGGMSDNYLQVVSLETHPEVKKSADILTVKDLKVGGLRSSSAADLLARLSLDTLGVKYKYIEGYRGGAKILAAIMQKEVGYMSSSHGMYSGSIIPNLVQEGNMRVLWYHPKKDEAGNFIPVPSLADVAPTFPEVYKEVHGKEPSGEYWDALSWVNDLGTSILRGLWAPPKVNEEALAILRKGFIDTINDPEYKDFVVKQFVVAQFVTFEKGEPLIDILKSTDPKMVDFLKEYIEAGSK